MLLEDQLAETREAFKNAHEAGNKEAAQALAQRVFQLETQISELKKAEQESLESQSSYRNPAVAGGAGAVVGAATNPLRGAIHDVIANEPAPASTPNTPINKVRTPYNPRGSSIEESVANWTNYADAQTEAARGVRRDTSLLKKYPNMQLGGAGSAASPTPEPPPLSAADKGKNLLMGLVADHQPTRPMDIVKGATRGAVTGAALADVPQQVAQGNYGTAAADVGVAGGNILHGLARTPKGRAIGALLGIGSGITRAGQGVNELMPAEQKAEGGPVHMAGGGSLGNALTMTALNAPYVAPTGAGIFKNIAKGAYAPAIEDTAGLALAMAPLNPLTAALSMMAPSEAGAGSTVDEWNARKAAERAALERAQRQYQHEEFMRKKVGANAPNFLQEYEAKLRGYAAGGTVLKKLVKPLWEKFGYDKYKIAQDYPEVIAPVLAKDVKTGNEYFKKQLSPEALLVQKARKDAQKQIDVGNYEPFFDIEKRYYADPTKYSLSGNTLTDAVPKKADTIAKYEALANNSESLARLRGAFEAAKDRPLAKDWYAMGQLEDAFIKELGPEEGRRQFKARFADAMAATTGGADPNSNLMMAAYTNYQKNLGREIPTAAADLPFPIGGRFVSGNMEQARKLADIGEISPVTNPKRHNFSANFLGNRDVSTLDEQMSQLWDPKMMAPPTNAYGIYEAALAREAEKAGVRPANFQDIAWAGAKNYPGKPMMQEINEMIERTHMITGEPKEEILKGFIRADKPMYGVAGLGLMGNSKDED